MPFRTVAVCSFLAALGIAAPAGPSMAQGILDATLAEQGVKSIEVSTAELRRILTDRSALVIDTRTRAEFDAGHIPGAINLDAPASKHVSAVTTVAGGDTTKALILYCNGPFCQASRRLGEQLVEAGFRNVRRYQLGMPVWRALGGPTVIELGGIERIFKLDRTAVFIDARPSDEFAGGSLAEARSAPVADVISGKLKKIDLPEDDFNRRIVLFGRDGAQARQLAEYMAKRPWHNVAYFPGAFVDLTAALKR